MYVTVIKILKFAIGNYFYITPCKLSSCVQRDMALLNAVAVSVLRSSVADVSTHKVAQSTATSATLSSRPLHYSVAGGLLSINRSIDECTPRLTLLTKNAIDLLIKHTRTHKPANTSS